MHRFRFVSKAPVLRRVIIGLCLCAYLTAGLYTELRLAGWKPIPSGVLEDFRYYERALSDALNGQDPYTDRSIGSGYLYPPPALLIVEVFNHIKPNVLKTAVFFTVNIVLLMLIVKGVATYYNYSLDRVWYWFVLCFGFAPFLELLHVGQINVFTMFGIFLLFIWESTFPIFAGLGLSLAIVTKVTPLLFLGYLLVNKSWKVIASTVIATIVLVVLGGLRYGLVPLLTYPDVFAGLLSQFPLGPNSQSFVAKVAVSDLPQFQVFLSSIPASLEQPLRSTSLLLTANHAVVQRILTLYILLVIGLSCLATFSGKQEREPLFIVTALGMMLSSNIMWYHHYVFVLLPVLIWMGWRRLSASVVIWCFIGLLVIQIDRFVPPYGFLIHVWGHISLLSILLWQWYTLYSKKLRSDALVKGSRPSS